ncbi:hypothetical protein GGS23DRAFT_549695 [Durotheca rogersii]|uniref:uncharacterized protein n=1 Tax=Durotheca rogersii TaxID=419775 RepID=UPI00221F92B4|nr:uncharacterized protein GGS23DRAFT_549695 [Durotheca rogersii]KAI5867733.1 hypothetical protein GGS23DRAFT_549695 [Durotheca rogersii]
MLEPWDEVITLQKEHQLCADDVKVIKASCIEDHGKKHPIECPDCWTRLLNRVRDRYLNSASREWFSGRRPFLLELDTMFSRAHNFEVDLKTIEQRILDEKKEWYRDKAKSLGLQMAAKSPSEARLLQQKISDRSISSDQLASELRAALNDGAAGDEEVFDRFMERWKLVKSPQARIDAYIDAFFRLGSDPSSGAKSKNYIDMIRDGTPIADVINAIVRDRDLAKSDCDQKRALHEQLEELKRAKAAHELDKAKRDKARQEKARVAASPPSEPYHLPPCSVCSKDPDPQDFSTCPLCQILSERCEIHVEPMVFCSQECEDKRFEPHIDEAHECASGQDCVRLQDDDVDMEDARSTLVLCRECVLNFRIPSVFCSPRCFDDSFQRHRDDIHLLEWKNMRQGVGDETQLEFDPEDRTRYRARDIEEHLVTLDHAMAEWQRKTGATAK